MVAVSSKKKKFKQNQNENLTPLQKSSNLENKLFEINTKMIDNIEIINKKYTTKHQTTINKRHFDFNINELLLLINRHC